MEECKTIVLASLRALHEEVDKELKGYEKQPGVFRQEDYVHRENLSSYRQTLEGIGEIVAYVEDFPEPVNMSVDEFCSKVLEKLADLYSRQVRLRAGIGMAMRCIENCGKGKR